jgi:hypothetical protein
VHAELATPLEFRKFSVDYQRMIENFQFGPNREKQNLKAMGNSCSIVSLQITLTRC